VAYQESDPVIDRLCGNHVQIVKDQGKGSQGLGYFVAQSGEKRLDRGRLGGLEHRQGGRSDVSIDGLQSGNDIGPEAGRIVIACIQ
jgi:hypothetical protein